MAKCMVAGCRCGLPNVLPTGMGSSPEILIESNTMVSGDHGSYRGQSMPGYGTLQLGLHVAAIDQEPVGESQKIAIDDEWFHERIALLVGSDSEPVKGDSKADNRMQQFVKVRIEKDGDRH